MRSYRPAYLSDLDLWPFDLTANGCWGPAIYFGVDNSNWIDTQTESEDTTDHYIHASAIADMCNDVASSVSILSTVVKCWE